MYPTPGREGPSSARICFACNAGIFFRWMKGREVYPGQVIKSPFLCILLLVGKALHPHRSSDAVLQSTFCLDLGFARSDKMLIAI